MLSPNALRVLVLFALLATASCTSPTPIVRLDPAVPDDEKALLSLTPGTWLRSLDGRTFRYLRWLDVELTPGEHVAVFHFVDNRTRVRLGLTSIEPVEVVFEAAAAHRYELRASIVSVRRPGAA